MTKKTKTRLIEVEKSRQTFVINTLFKHGLWNNQPEYVQDAFVKAGMYIYRNAHRAGLCGFESARVNDLKRELETLRTQVWNEAMDEAVRVSDEVVFTDHKEFIEALKKLKHQSNNPATSDISVR